jgi:hypothetical protein
MMLPRGIWQCHSQLRTDYGIHAELRGVNGSACLPVRAAMYLPYLCFRQTPCPLTVRQGARGWNALAKPRRA